MLHLIRKKNREIDNFFYIDTQSMYLFSNIDLGNTTYRKRAKTFIEFYNEKQTIKINNIDIHKSDKNGNNCVLVAQNSKSYGILILCLKL